MPYFYILYMRFRVFLIVFGVLYVLNYYKAQQTFPVNGAPYSHQAIHVFEHAHIVVNPTLTLSDAQMVIRGSIILEVGNNIKIPQNAIRHNLNGAYIYPSFIETYSDFGIVPHLYAPKTHPGPQLLSTRNSNLGWNMAIRSEIEAQDFYQYDNERADHYRKSGFAVINSHHNDGIARGTAVLSELHQIPEHSQIIKAKSASVLGFEKGSSPQDYPSSLTGAMALLRQTAYDAQWYVQQSQEQNKSLEAFHANLKLPMLFVSRNKWESLGFSKLAKEFKWNSWIVSSGDEYQRIQDIKACGQPFILPLKFPEMPDVDHPAYATRITLSELKHWELAPSNPYFFQQQQIPFCLTAQGIANPDQFFTHLQLAVSRGLQTSKALEALTVLPAKMLGVEQFLGCIKNGYHANFFITNTSVFDAGCYMLSHWVSGQEFKYRSTESAEMEGIYRYPNTLQVFTLTAQGSAPLTLNAKYAIQCQGYQAYWNYKDSSGAYTFSGTYNVKQKIWEGRLVYNDSAFQVQIPKVQNQNRVVVPNTKTDSVEKQLGDIWYPFTAYGQTASEIAAFQNTKPVLIRQAQVWLKDSVTPTRCDVFIEKGKIVSIDKSIPFQEGKMTCIEAQQLHLTPGIIDEHSHIALRGGVNEGTEASSAEVRMADVINPEDVSIYQQMAAGVTAAQLLHGSANPIGGQSAIIKLRWGASAEGMLFENADPFIKFALGENVKQSNWGDYQNQRFPQTRMGVEQVYRDYFTRAMHYSKSKIEARENKLPFRTDLDLEALSEIILGKRFITCHSYVQSEINMLMHVATDYNFKVNTFTHILEGYKVADKMKAHGVFASTFSDWWAYKNEVMEAIPYNAEILTRMGVITAINSDDAEMGRRLNQEAAKTLKYGHLNAAQALALITANPAQMLHLNKRVGTISVGMDADIVLWDGDPLSVLSKAVYTFIDGKAYFSQSSYQKLVLRNEAEKKRLIAKIRFLKSKGVTGSVPVFKPHRYYHCETLDLEY